MKGIFNAIKDFFSVVVSLLEFIFKGLILLFNLLFQGLRILIECIQLLPTPLIVGGIALIVVCVLYKILGRESNG